MKVNLPILRTSLFLLVPALLAAQTYQATFAHARNLLREKQFAAALEEGRRAMHLDNTRWEGWFVAGTAAVGLSKYDLAIDYFQESLSRAPDSVRPTVNDAIASCRRAAAAQPDPSISASPSPVYAQPAVQPDPEHPTLMHRDTPAAPQQQAEAPTGVSVRAVTFAMVGTMCTGTLKAANGMVSFQADSNEATCQKHNFIVPRNQIRSYDYNGLTGTALPTAFHVKLSRGGTQNYCQADANDVATFFAALGTQ